MRPFAIAVAAFCLACPFGATRPASAATITIINNDSSNEGMNDGKSVAPVGGNPGLTLGAQRLNALQHAADLFAAELASTVEVEIGATFDSLGGSQLGAFLAFAGPRTVHRDFPGAPRSHTFYPAALANSFAKADLNGVSDDVRSRFNKDVDKSSVLGNISFYYGLDGRAGSDIDLVTVALHEFAHGLGFLTEFNVTNGVKRNCSVSPGGCVDAFTLQLVDDNFTPSDLASMSNSQRASAATDEPDLLWAGANVIAASGPLTEGARADGRVEMYAPNRAVQSSSVSHFSTELKPNELMEPSYTAPLRRLELTIAALIDVGWRRPGDTTTTTSSTTTLAPAALCGDANGDDSVTPTDALIALKTFVGTADCSPLVCDVNSDGSVTPTDARSILVLAVGEDVTLACPAA